ncbi:MarR family winged helix-turn-helix transcriptional regulator [Paenibacillus guangzhouensis]|uniref:MarR family winged helix-turn-helix transcriptional regulator n=1 Tax=Paenibacillus guangzhouensis TaxID=1473112 RepID=UPI0012674ACE|nr:MarR family transcriptional regulator [Paenibacillus guangzhouensis]
MPINTELVEVTTLFKTLIKRVTQNWNKRMVHQLTYPQFKMLFKLEKHGPQKVSQLAEALCITSGAVTGAADRLLSEGYIERTRAADDRRVVYIQITEEGRRITHQVMEDQKETIAMFFGSLPDEDIKHLKRIMTTVLAKIDN